MQRPRTSGTAPKSEAEKPKRTRDPVRSKQTILRTAIAEFCQHGFSGARIERIATKSKSNMRMIYHYFGDKEGLYLAVLDTAYTRIRQEESKLDLSEMNPMDGMRSLIRFTFDFFAANNDVLSLISNENTLRAKYLRRLPHVRTMTLPLLESIDRLARAGYQQGAFLRQIDPIQFYVSLVALSQIHITNRYTLSTLFDQDLATPDWLKSRRKHVEGLLISYISTEE